jgi:hypothetical protein
MTWRSLWMLIPGGLLGWALDDTLEAKLAIKAFSGTGLFWDVHEKTQTYRASPRQT